MNTNSIDGSQQIHGFVELFQLHEVISHACDLRHIGILANAI